MPASNIVKKKISFNKEINIQNLKIEDKDVCLQNDIIVTIDAIVPANDVVVTTDEIIPIADIVANEVVDVIVPTTDVTLPKLAPSTKFFSSTKLSNLTRFLPR